MTTRNRPHRCIAVLEKSLIKELGKEVEPEVEVGFHFFSKPTTRFIGIPVTMLDRKRNGQVGKKRVTKYVQYNYCPMCGEKLESDDSES